MMEQVGFRYGILCDRLEEQANKQGYTLGKDQEDFEKIREAINICMFHVATDSQVKQMFTKLNKQVVKSLKPLNKI